MFKSFLSTSLIISSVILFAGCSGDKSGPGAIDKAQAVPDASEKVFTGLDVKTMSVSDVAALSANNEACKDDDSSGHKIIDPRLVDGYKFPRTTIVGNQDKRTFDEVLTVLSPTPDSFVLQDDYKIESTEHSVKNECSFKNMQGSHALNCIDENGNERKLAMPYVRAKRFCHLESPQAKPIVTTSKQLVVFDKPITAIRSVKEVTGQLVCNGKPMGPGRTIKSETYSYDIPSLTQDSCHPGELYFHWTILDANKNIMENRSSGLTGFEDLKAPDNSVDY